MIIDGFIRHRLPCGTPEAYPEAELESYASAHRDRRSSPGDSCPAAKTKDESDLPPANAEVSPGSSPRTRNR